MITVQLLGGASLRSGDAPLSGPPAQRHRIALLTLIVAAWPQSLSRDRAMALLWPERDTASARRLLNLAVHVLRAALGEGAIASTGDGLLLNPSLLTCDLHELRSAIAANASENVVRLYAGPTIRPISVTGSMSAGAKSITPISAHCSRWPRGRSNREMCMVEWARAGGWWRVIRTRVCTRRR